MDSNYIYQQINEQIKLNSKFDLHRNYLGISKISDCPKAIVIEYNNGIQPTEASYRFSFAGYENEHSILSLLGKAVIADFDTFGMEVVAPFDNRLRGHIDGLTRDGDLLEIKSVTVNKFRQVYNSERAFTNHYVQVQLYMLYGNLKLAHVIYRCRETYEHAIIDVPFSVDHAKTYEEKAKCILKAIDDNRIPDCICGRHN